MKQNKGVIGLGLILAIVLGVAVVGGGAYYLGNNKHNKGDSITPSQYRSTEEYKINNPLSDCKSNSPSSIKLISPNGGEVFKVGDTMIIKWNSCNAKGGIEGLKIGSFPYDNYNNFTNIDISNLKIDDKTLTWNIPSNIDTTKKYKIFIKTGMFIQGNTEYELSDDSDNSFTINSSSKEVSLDISSELAKKYKTAFTEALKNPANFNGHYVVASWGCGSGCLSYGIVDKLTGKVYQGPSDDYGNTASYSGDESFNKTRWSVGSNLFKAIGYTSIDTYKFENEKFTKIKSDPFVNSTEESSTESFKNQPGDIKSIKADGANRWILAVDLLTHNPDWLPGNDSSGPFFFNKNTKIRNLIIDNNTIIKNCKSMMSDFYSGFDNNSLSFINYVQDIIRRYAAGEIPGEFHYTAYFDISGLNITTVYQQCLP